jgi:hypothetical protein
MLEAVQGGERSDVLLKGTVSRDFLPQIFSINHLPHAPLLIIALGSFRIFASCSTNVRQLIIHSPILSILLTF